MKYRTFGKTGLQISALGFGCMRLPVIDKDRSQIDERRAMEMVHLAIDKGVNYFDTAYPYHGKDFSSGGAGEPFLARALKKADRENIHIATKLPSWMIETRKDMDRFLDEQLERLDTGYIDFYLLHALKRSLWDKLVGQGILEFLDSAIKSGKIRHAGFSFHDDLSLFKEIVDAYEWSLCQIQYNYFDEDYQAGREGLEYAAERNIAVVVMEPLRGGLLVKDLPAETSQILEETASGRSAVEWAFRWLWDQPGVSTILSGMSQLDQMKENLDLAENVSEAPWTEKDEEAVRKAKRIIDELQRVNCTTCGYCMPCPEGVDIPFNLALSNDHHIFKDQGAKFRYKLVLSESERASNCVQCGQCLEKCPQQISIPDELEHVADLFELK
jgi:predicted aldo/keto reductase-like oxidoreductase